MKKQDELMKQRLQSIMQAERHSGMETLLASLKSDLVTVFGSYMALREGAMTVEVHTQDGSEVEFLVRVQTKSLYDAGKMIPWED